MKWLNTDCAALVIFGDEDIRPRNFFLNENSSFLETSIKKYRISFFKGDKIPVFITLRFYILSTCNSNIFTLYTILLVITFNHVQSACVLLRKNY